MFPQNNESTIHEVYSHDRSTFFGKVMGCFGLAMLASMAGTWVGFKYFLGFILQNPMLMWVAFAVELILIFTSRKWSQIRPLNYWLFGAFAFITGLTITPLVAAALYQAGGPDILIKAFLVTALMFGGTAAYGWTTKRDLSGLGGFLTISLIGMIVISIIGIFLPWGNSFEMMFAGFGVLLFSGYTMYDIQMLKHYPEDRYIDAALNLYLDIFNLFVMILRLLLAFNRD